MPLALWSDLHSVATKGHYQYWLPSPRRIWVFPSPPPNRRLLVEPLVSVPCGRCRWCSMVFHGYCTVFFVGVASFFITALTSAGIMAFCFCIHHLRSLTITWNNSIWRELILELTQENKAVSCPERCAYLFQSRSDLSVWEFPGGTEGKEQSQSQSQSQNYIIQDISY